MASCQSSSFENISFICDAFATEITTRIESDLFGDFWWRTDDKTAKSIHDRILDIIIKLDKFKCGSGEPLVFLGNPFGFINNLRS